MFTRHPDRKQRFLLTKIKEKWPHLYKKYQLIFNNDVEYVDPKKLYIYFPYDYLIIPEYSDFENMLEYLLPNDLILIETLEYYEDK